MNSKSSALLLFLSALIVTASTVSKVCDITKTVGTSFQINLKPEPQLEENDDVKWTHNNVFVFRKKSGKTNRDNTKTMESNGSLNIKNVNKKDEGTYQFEAYSANGKSKGKQIISLCVQEKLPKPTVKVTCTDGKLFVICEVQDKTGLTFVWYKNNHKMTEKSESIIVDDDQEYACAVEKSSSIEKSDKVTPAETKCSRTGSQPGQDQLWGFDRWIMISILAGGGGLVLLLMIVLIICACQSCKRREKHLQDEEEFRLSNFHTPTNSGQQRSKHTARGQPAPPIPQEDPEVSNYEVDDPLPKTQPRTKKSPRPPPPPVDDDEQPPPLPQPRTKAAHGKKNQTLYMQP